MEFITEYGLLVAVATPVGVIALINVLLAIGGEKGTLLLPSLRGYPAVLPEAQGMARAEQPVVDCAVEAKPARVVREPVAAGFDEADEMLVRQAA
jgi:hypothetical protein